MKRIHYLNIGMAKAGTTAIYNGLISHPEVDFQKEKENFQYSNFGYTLEEYCKYYQDSEVSLNMNTNQWAMESKQISEIDKVATHYSIIFRNPYEFITSLFSFLPTTETSQTHTYESFIDMIDRRAHV